MPKCQICGVDHDGVKEVKVVVRPFFDVNIEGLYPGCDVSPFSALNEDASDIRSFFICSNCASNVHGLLTKDPNFPYDNDSFTSSYILKYFYDVYYDCFVAVDLSYSTCIVNARGYSVVKYATDENNADTVGIYNYQAYGYVVNPACYQSIVFTSINNSFCHKSICFERWGHWYDLDLYVSTVECYECGTTIPAIDAVFSELINEDVCSDCYDVILEREEEDQYDSEEDSTGFDCNIKEYGYKPIPIFYKVNNDSSLYDVATELHKGLPEPFFGVELEVDMPSSGYSCSANVDNDAGTLRETIPLFDDLYYIKHDGSLNCGMEIVSHPMTLKYHLEKAPWEAILKECVSMGYRSNDVSTCGLHIHINSNSLGRTYEDVSDTMYKMVLFTEVLWNDFRKFSRRRSMSFCGKYDSYVPNEDFKKFKDKVGGKAFRNAAVNITNRKTVEIRIIKGTLNLVSFRAALQFAFLLRLLSMELTDKAITKSSFMVFKDSAEILGFTDFLKYCEIRGL